MLTAVKNQMKVTFLGVKYAIMREMLNKTTFLTNIIFMILNNASFIIEWLILYSLRENVGGYSFKQVLLLWGLASGTYGFTHFFFKKSHDLSDTINNGKLDSYLVLPKNVLISCITSDVEVSALG
ncbi:MAG: ABC-2 family transporter protein, partial [Bacilli bacterium]|nr:ABC-2 family transporter protein [Bacilli bacterium]